MITCSRRCKINMAPRKKNKNSSNLKAAYEVYQHIPIIETVRKAKNPHLRGQILQLSPSTVRAISNLTVNAASGNLPLSKSTQKQLEKMNKHVQAVTKGTMESRRKAIQQGGFLPLLAKLVPIAAGVIGSLIGGSRRE